MSKDLTFGRDFDGSPEKAGLERGAAPDPERKARTGDLSCQDSRWIAGDLRQHSKVLGLG